MSEPQINSALDIRLSLDDIVNMFYQEQKDSLEKQLEEVQKEIANNQLKIEELAKTSYALIEQTFSKTFLQSPDAITAQKFLTQLNPDHKILITIESDLFTSNNKYKCSLDLYCKDKNLAEIFTSTIEGDSQVLKNSKENTLLTSEIKNSFKEVQRIKTIINNPSAIKDKIRAKYTKDYLAKNKLDTQGMKLALT